MRTPAGEKLLVAALAALTVVTWSAVLTTHGDAPSASPSSPASGSASAEDPVRVVVVGDDLTDRRTQPDRTFLETAAARLGWDARVVDGGAGTGYLNRGPTEAGTLAERLRRQPGDPEVDLTVLQGGSADGPILLANPNLPLDRAVRRTLRLAQQRYAGSEVLVLGPVSTRDPEPVLRGIDRTLARVSRSAGATYLSPLRQGWSTDADRLADRLVAAVGDLPPG